MSNVATGVASPVGPGAPKVYQLSPPLNGVEYVRSTYVVGDGEDTFTVVFKCDSSGKILTTEVEGVPKIVELARVAGKNHPSALAAIGYTNAP